MPLDLSTLPPDLRATWPTPASTCRRSYELATCPTANSPSHADYNSPPVELVKAGMKGLGIYSLCIVLGLVGVLMILWFIVGLFLLADPSGAGGD
jgi:hypothetical protein